VSELVSEVTVQRKSSRFDVRVWLGLQFRVRFMRVG